MRLTTRFFINGSRKKGNKTAFARQTSINITVPTIRLSETISVSENNNPTNNGNTFSHGLKNGDLNLFNRLKLILINAFCSTKARCNP